LKAEFIKKRGCYLLHRKKKKTEKNGKRHEWEGKIEVLVIVRKNKKESLRGGKDGVEYPGQESSAKNSQQGKILEFGTRPNERNFRPRKLGEKKPFVEEFL